jgi:S1-C subfamily serine protease
MRVWSIVIAVVLLATQAPPAPAQDATRTSVVRIEALRRAPDLVRPWKKRGQQSSSGTGVVIQGKRILANAHVVRDAVDLSVQPDRSGEKLAATVEAIAPGIDLAVLRLEDESFFDDHRPLELSREVAKVQDAVAVYGYPDHGIDLSVTRGIVSRIDFVTYWEDPASSALRLQVDAALNPGNSGGPVLSGDKMIGVAFAGVGGAENVG